MEYYWTLLNNGSSNTCGNVSGDNNGNCSSDHAWESSGELGTIGGSSVDCSYHLRNSLTLSAQPTAAAIAVASTSAEQVGADPFHRLMQLQRGKTDGSPSLYCVGKESLLNTLDPHLTCLNLGKRHYFEAVTASQPGERPVAAGPSSSASKKGKPYCSSTREASVADAAALAVVPRCQVEGCEVELVNAKDYHRRHKVCAAHAKAPKVVVLGIEQRFCQQCSRFHSVAEFDESKRSCRRRLAGHNERRRKSSQEQNSLAKRPLQGRHPHFLNNGECALSLLSSTNPDPWNPTSAADLPSRCSAALRELIAENRASVLACKQLIYPSNQMEDYSAYKHDPIRAGSHPQANGGRLTLDLMQACNPAFGLLSLDGGKPPSKEGDQGGGCSELWKVPLGY